MEKARYDVAILGGGAAGLMCAFAAGQRGRRVVLLEHQDRVGRKIAISGGGRCNFTNLSATWEQYQSEQPSFCKSALARYTPQDFIALVERHGISYHEKTLGQQFCDGSSRAIIDMLLAECAAAKVEIRCSCRVVEVQWTERFQLTTTAGTVEANTLVVATGGLSFPKLGASDFGYRLARQFRLPVTELRPGLVPLTLNGEMLAMASSLSGVSLPVVARSGGSAFRESLLFTHRGLSGPAILQASSYWREGGLLELDLAPDTNHAGWPRRFAETWLSRHAERPLERMKNVERAAFERNLHAWTLRPAGTEGYAKAEVTLGGVATSALSSKTMEAREVPGLFFIGEVVDVTGWLGGYNFQWAWSSAQAAAAAV